MINFKNYARFSLLGFLLIQCSFAYAQPSNDNPCNAIPLTVGTSCVFTAATNVAATNTAGVPVPGCASYNGQDVWYSIVVPAGGVLNIDSNTGSITDGGMAAYSGTCSSLSLISCDDDNSPNGLMPYLNLTGLTVGSTIYIRFWEYGGGTGTFSICASAPTPPTPAPPCGSSPPAGNTCATATPICNLNGYCGNTSGSYTANTWGAAGAPIGCGFLGFEACPGTGLTGVFCGSIENNSFLSFTASESSISFNVWVNSSTLGYGIQILIFSAVNCSGDITQYGPCYNPGVVEPGPVNITANGLTPGNTYYIMIDGNAGDICNYTIGADTGISTPVLVDPSSITICQGESVNLTASGGDGTYTWNASPDLNTTSGANVIATPSSSGTFNYTVNSATGNPLCPSSTFSTAVVTVDDCGCGVTANNSGPICSGETADLTATTIVDVTYSWVGPNGFLSSDQNPINVTVPTTPGTYDYTVTATPLVGDPCVSVTTITVNANPTVDAGTYSTVCDNDADIVLVGSPSGGVFSGTGVSGTNFDPSAGTQTITYNYTDVNSCTNSDQVTINVTPQVILDVTSINMTCDTTLLWTEWNTFVPNPVLGTVNGTIDVTVTHSSGDLTSTAQMFNGATFPPEYNVPTASSAIRNDLAGLITFCFDSPVVNPQIALSSIGNLGTPVQINTSDPYAVVWNGTAMTYLNNQSFIGEEGFTIISFPGTHTCISLDFLQGESYINIAIGIEDINCSTDPMCEGGSVVFNASGASNYSWSPATGLNSTTGSSVTASPTSTTTYIVVDANDVGCSIPASITVIVNPNPVADAGNYSAICSDANDIPLAGLPVGGTFTGTGVTGSNFDPSVGTQTITYDYTDANGCSDSDQTVITVNPLPIIEAGNDQTICIGSEVTLTGSGGNSYVWDNNGEDGVSFTPSEGTITFTVVGTDVNGCINTDQVTITVLPTPEANLSSDVNSGNAPLEVTFFNNSLFGTTYNWSFGDGATMNSFNLSNAQHTYSAGEYEVILIASNGVCQDSDTISIIVFPPLAPEIHIPNVFTPNGDNANDVFFIGATNVTSVNVKIFNRWGEMMHEIKSPLEFWDGRTANGNEANDGVYFIKYEVVGVNGEVLSGHGNVSLVR